VALLLARTAAAIAAATFGIAAAFAIAVAPSSAVFGVVVLASGAWCAWIERQHGPL
jgi:hypothetical protein